MELKELKNSIENKTLKFNFLIFNYADNDFLPMQYLHEIRKIFNVDIQYIEDIDKDIGLNSNFFFGETEVNSLKVFLCDTFDNTNVNYNDKDNLIVICKKISKEVSNLFSDNIVIFPKLEEWQIKDYVYSLAPGVPEIELDKLIKICNNNIYRLDKELHKIKIFTETEQKYVYSKFMDDGIFSDLSEHNIFDFCNAILKKDINTLSNLYQELNKIDVEPLGLVKLLYDNLKTIIFIQYDPTATAESIGMAPNRFWAIKKNTCGFYTKDQLMSSFYLITDIDRKLKTGEITVDIMIDYIVTHIFSF